MKLVIDDNVNKAVKVLPAISVSNYHYCRGFISFGNRLTPNDIGIHGRRKCCNTSGVATDKPAIVAWGLGLNEPASAKDNFFQKIYERYTKLTLLTYLGNII